MLHIAFVLGWAVQNKNLLWLNIGFDWEILQGWWGKKNNQWATFQIQTYKWIKIKNKKNRKLTPLWRHLTAVNLTQQYPLCSFE